MPRPTRHRALSLVLGVGTGAGLRWLGTDLVLTTAAAISVLVLGLVGGRIVRDRPADAGNGTSWRDNRWGAAGQAFVILVAFQAVYAVSVSFANRVGLLVVVIATFTIGYFAGGLDALERDSSGAGDGQADAVVSADD